MLGRSDAGQNVLRLSLTENCSSYTNSAYICNKTSKNDDKKILTSSLVKHFPA